MAQDYRPDIDGLRAIAVLGVILFHVGFKAFSGGFVGVDVFFVISGFLITRLIKDQAEAGAFSFRRFYIRRARRLLPALLFTTTASLIAAIFLLSPRQLEEFGGSAVSSGLSLANLYFYRQSGYFDSDAISKPLLHTWSLSVEEQFYLVWPTLLIVLLTISRRAIPLIILATGLAGFALTAYFSPHTNAVFYLAPFRVFEFALGALVVWAVEHRPARNVVLELGLVIGLALVVFSIVGHAAPVFSGVVAVAPCLGTALVLYAGTARYSGAILRNRVAVGLGLISYSLYLVHWPLIVFLKYNKFEDFHAVEKWGIVGASIATAMLMYVCVEKPFRRRTDDRGKHSDKRFLLGYAAALIVVSSVAAHAWTTGGWLWRYPKTIRRQIQADAIEADQNYTWRAFRSANGPFSADNSRKILLVGDSQGADFINMLAETGDLESAEFKTVELDKPCQSLISLSREQLNSLSKTDRAACEPAFTRLIETDAISRADDVVLALNWDDRGIPFIDRAVQALHERGVKKVFVVGRKSQGYGGPDVVLRYGIANGIDALSASRKEASAWRANARIASLKSDFVYVDVMSQVCPSTTSCRVLTDEKDIIFFDGSHFTPAGAKYIGRLLSKGGAFAF